MSEPWKLMVDPDRLDKWMADGLNNTDILMMLRLGEHARKSVLCYPSNDKLAKKTGLKSTRGAGKVLSKLKKLGKIKLVYRDAKKEERYIVMLEREHDAYKTPSVPADAMTIEWVDAVRLGGPGTDVPGCGTPVPSRRNSSSRGVEPQFQGGGTPVPQNKNEENKYEVNKDSEKKIPPPAPHGRQEPSGLNGEGGTAFASGEEMPVRPKPTPRPKADPERRSVVAEDVNPKPTVKAPSNTEIPDNARRLILEHVGEEGVRKWSRALAKAGGKVEAVEAGARYVGRAKNVEDPVALWISKCGEFAAKIPEAFADREKQRRIERVMDFGNLRLDITTHIRRRSDGKHSPAEIREEALRLIDDQSRKVGLTGEQAEQRIQFARELLTDAEIAYRQQTDQQNAERKAKEEAEREARFASLDNDPAVLRMMAKLRGSGPPTNDAWKTQAAASQNAAAIERTS